MPPAWDLSCHYPGCGGGNIARKKFCPKHIKTPFETKAEVNAYSRAKKEARADLVWLLATLEGANHVIVSEGLDDGEEVEPIREQMKDICKRWKLDICKRWKLQYPGESAS